MSSTIIQSQPKIAVTVKLDEQLVKEIADLKQEFANRGKYFSITSSVQSAIENAIVNGRNELQRLNEQNADDTFI